MDSYTVLAAALFFYSISLLPTDTKHRATYLRQQCFCFPASNCKFSSSANIYIHAYLAISEVEMDTWKQLVKMTQNVGCPTVYLLFS